MQPTMKMSPAKVRSLLAAERDLDESEIGRRETVPAISCVRVRRASMRPKSGPVPAGTTAPSTSLLPTVTTPPQRPEAIILRPTPVPITDRDVRVELEPVFDSDQIRIIGQEARIIHAPPRESDERRRSEHLRRRGRELAVKKFLEGGPHVGSKLFIDVLPIDLLDPELYNEGTPLANIATKVVLQLRGRLGEVMIEDLRARLSVLRFQGYRIAIADIDSAPARLSLIAEVAPEFLKIDASLIRGINRSEAKKRIVTGLTTMCRLLGTVPIAEGVATAEERASLFESGCFMVQGPLHRHDDDYALPVRKDPPLRAVGGMRRR